MLGTWWWSSGQWACLQSSNPAEAYSFSVPEMLLEKNEINKTRPELAHFFKKCA